MHVWINDDAYAEFQCQCPLGIGSIPIRSRFFRSICSTWWTLYQKEGKEALKIKQRGRPKGSCRTLTMEQEKELQKAIRDKCPDQMKLPFALWTRVAVQQLIKQLWAIEMPIRTVGEYLYR